MVLAFFVALGTASAAEIPVQFVDVTRAAGIFWTHHNGASPDKYLIETMGGGGAFLDFDGDGYLDILLVDSGTHPASPHPSPARNALLHNRGDGTFEDVSLQAGVVVDAYANGIAVGDYDNDGDPDILLTTWGRDLLLRNRNDGTFEEVGLAVGLNAKGWSTSAAFFDLENDGDLDLFICRYLDWDLKKEIFCGQREPRRRSYCHPSKYSPITSLLYRNQGDGTFQEISKKAGIALPGKALGVVAGHIDSDDRIDLYVANDTTANFLFRNLGDGGFQEEALLAEVAYGASVKPESGMGTDLGDFDGDGQADLIVTNIDYEMNNLYRRSSQGFFDDVTISHGNGRGDLRLSGFGVRFFDFDNDGDLDLVVLNGHPVDDIHNYRKDVQAAEPPTLLENRNGRFHDVGSQAGAIWRRKLQGRALATGDYDNDGDLDLLFVNNGSAPVLLRNEGGHRNPWWGVTLVGTKSNRDAVGARVTITTDRRRIVRQRLGGGSYQAAHDPRLHFGFLPGESIKAVEIRWPDGQVQSLDPPLLNRYATLRQPSR